MKDCGFCSATIEPGRGAVWYLYAPALTPVYLCGACYAYAGKRRRALRESRSAEVPTHAL